jgi:hypothetical protein
MNNKHRDFFLSTKEDLYQAIKCILRLADALGDGSSLEVTVTGVHPECRPLTTDGTGQV